MNQRSKTFGTSLNTQTPRKRAPFRRTKLLVASISLAIILLGCSQLQKTKPPASHKLEYYHRIKLRLKYKDLGGYIHPLVLHPGDIVQVRRDESLYKTTIFLDEIIKNRRSEINFPLSEEWFDRASYQRDNVCLSFSSLKRLSPKCNFGKSKFICGTVNGYSDIYLDPENYFDGLVFYDILWKAQFCYLVGDVKFVRK